MQFRLLSQDLDVDSMGDAVSKLDMGDLLACRTEVLAEPLQRGVDRKVEIYVTQHLDLK